MSKAVDIYSTDLCPYCVRAKILLDKKGVSYTEFRIDQNPELVDEVVNRAGGRTTVPQIFIDNVHVGGCDELYALEKEGDLDGLLGLEGG